jgi:hypothetical protein
MTNKLNVGDLVTKGLIYLVSFWICVALITQGYFIYLNVSGNNQKARELRDDFDTLVIIRGGRRKTRKTKPKSKPKHK